MMMYVIIRTGSHLERYECISIIWIWKDFYGGKFQWCFESFSKVSVKIPAENLPSDV